MFAKSNIVAWLVVGLLGLALGMPAAAATPPRPALDLHEASKPEGPQEGVSLLSALLPQCELAAKKTLFRQGETVQASWSVENPSPLRVALEFRVQLKAPGDAPVPRVSSMRSGRPVQPTGSVGEGRGQVSILTVGEQTTRGLYEMSCRLLDSSTGLVLAEDRNAFRVR